MSGVQTLAGLIEGPSQNVSYDKTEDETLGVGSKRLKDPDQANAGCMFNHVESRGLWRRIMSGQVQLSLCLGVRCLLCS
jgi:hypothetical protein